MKIAIDAGHYYGEPGRRNLKQFDPNETREWQMNDRVARHFVEAAKAYDVELLRTDDPTGKVETSLSDRAYKANKFGADFFISFHHNAGIAGGSGGGVEAYSYPNSKNGSKYRDAIYEAVIAAGGIRGNRATPKKEANFAVLRETNMPAVLMEYGFMDSSYDVPIICTDAYSKKVAYATMEGIAKVAGLKRKELDMSKYFKDVPDNAWYADEVDYCKEHGLMNGKSNTEFAPNDNMTRAEVAAVIARLHKALK
jgi:N-acetylmuramoyl-L-alanine amidase